MPVFRYDNYTDDLTPADWKVGDPWDQHYASVGFNDRDTQLEDFVNNDAHNSFTAVIFQNNIPLASTTEIANISFLQGMVDVEFFAIIGAAGTANREIRVAPAGLPFCRTPTTFGGASEFKPIGTFVYREAAAGWHVGAVGFDDVSLLFIVDGSAGLPLGQSPNFAAANTDQLAFTLRYRYKVV